MNATPADLPALLGEHPRRDAVVLKLARFMQPNEPSVANLVRLVKANPKGWAYRSGLTDPDRLFIVDAMTTAGLLDGVPDAPVEPTPAEAKVWGLVSRALREGRLISGITEGERRCVYAALAKCGGREEVQKKLRWSNPPADLAGQFVAAYRRAVDAGVAA